MHFLHRGLLITVIVLAFALAACSPSTTVAGDPLPSGDAERGAALFTESVGGAPACSTCHTLDGTTRVGPSLQGYADRAGTRVAGQSAEDYTHISIIRPAAYIVDGYGNSMYIQYEQRLASQQIADLVAYLLTL